jgi:hypothetical protein
MTVGFVDVEEKEGEDGVKCFIGGRGVHFEGLVATYGMVTPHPAEEGTGRLSG